ncbi:ATP-binding cassette domain-containing protein [Acinetobacter baumannii]
MSAPSSFAPPRLELRGISKRYPGCLANDRIDLCIDAGEIHALLGENGAGKSTLMKIIYGVTRPDAGEVRWQGEPVQVRDPARARALGIGMVFQHFNLFPHMTVLENLCLAQRVVRKRGKAEREAKARALLAKVGIGQKADEYPSRLSGGQQQRLVIARTIAVEPEVLLLDEPCSALDPISTLKIEELIYELKSKFTIVIVTHNMQQAARVSDYTAFMSMGKLIEFGDTDTLFTNPAKKQTEDYITGRYG